MKVLAVDPSINFTGYGIAEDGNLLDSELINATNEKTDALKLLKLHNSIQRIIESQTLIIVPKTYDIDFAYVEKPPPFIRKSKMTAKNLNVNSVQKLSMAYGVIIMTIQSYGIEIRDVSPQLARKERAIELAKEILNICRWKKLGENKYMFPDGDIRKLTTHESESIIWSCHYSRQM